MAITERSYVSTLRAELDADGNVTKRESHQRTDVMRGDEVITFKEKRVELDEAAFTAAVGKQYAAALVQIETLTTQEAQLTKDLTDMTTERDGLQVDKDALEADQTAKAEQIVTLTTEKTEALAEVSTLTPALASVTAERDAGAIQVAALQTQLATANTSASEAQAEVATLTPALAAMTAERDALAAQIVELTKPPVNEIKKSVFVDRLIAAELIKQFIGALGEEGGPAFERFRAMEVIRVDDAELRKIIAGIGGDVDALLKVE